MSAPKSGDHGARRPVLSLLAGAAVSILAAAASPSAAQTAAPAARDSATDDAEVEELVVTAAGRAQRGAVIGDIAPEIQLSARDIRGYGVSSVTELLDALAPQLSSARGTGGRPVILINGARTSGFAEVRDLPTEAIARIDILPEEVSLKYGYPADQRVLNIVLRPRFRALTAEAGYKAPTQAGGGDTTTAHANVLKILREQRLQLDVKASQDTALLESERNLVGRSDGAFRTLSPEGRDLAVNAVATRPLGGGVSGTLNATAEVSDSEGKLGLSPFSGEALERRSKTTDGHLGAAMNGAYAGWRWSYTGGADSNDSKSTTQRAFGGLAYTDRSTSRTTSATSDLVLNRSLFAVPAGAVSTALSVKVETLDFKSESSRAGISRSQTLSRDSGRLQASLDVPLTRRTQAVPSGVGDISANLNLAVLNLSDFGALTTVGYGANWSPVKPVRFIASFTQEDVAPTIQQLGNPEQATPGVTVFDLRRGETALITRIDGGSRTLDSAERRVVKLGLTLKPFDKTNLTLQANYISSHARDALADFPSSSTQAEAAFPERFLRDAQGRLVQIDARPVNYARQDRDELRWGFTYVKQLPGARPPGGGAGQTPSGQQGQRANGRGSDGAPGEGGPPPEGAPPPGGDRPGGGFGGPGGPGGFGGPPGGGGGGGGFGGGRGGFGGGGVFQIGLYHTVAFKDEILIRSGVPVLNLLDGAAIGAGGGSPRHQVDLQANLTKNGVGAAMNAKWQSATTVRGAGAAGDLNFSDLTTVNLRLFADLGLRYGRNHPWLRAARVTVSIDNLFDTREEVRTASGAIPISYQPDYLDPVGRSVKLNLRKLFF